MRDVAWRIGFTLTVLAALLVLAPDGNRTRAYHLLEQALGHTPQAEVTRFLTAVAKGDRPTALALWPGSQGADAALEARRKWVLDDLEALGPQLQHRVLEVEWWRTCCEPGVIEDPRQAGAARVRAAVRGVNQPERIYLFDLQVPGGYPGTAAGGRVRQWAILDVYPEGQAPLAWAWSE
jgi:hypothetical protein